MDLMRFIVIPAFLVQGMALLIAGYRLHGKGIAAGGRPTTGKALFYSGKISLFSSWTLFIVKAIVPSLGWFATPPLLALAGVLLLCAGSLILIVSFFGLSSSLRVGLPKEETTLVTSGPYSFSRNPIYIGVFAICIASCLYFPDPVNIVLACYGMFVHHRIILGEEKFLEERFGKAWEEYKARVRRYL